MLDLIQVRSFCMVAAELHFGRAAQKLNMTQPPLSRQIKLLEEALGVTLFERGRQGVSLTAAGRIFLPEAKALISKSDELVRKTRASAKKQPGLLRLGFVPAASYHFLPAYLAALRRELPEAELTLHEANTLPMADEIISHRLDIGVVRPQAKPLPLASRWVMSERLALAARHDHPLARQRRIELAMLEGQDFVMYSPQAPYLHDMVGQLLKSSGVAPRIVQQLNAAPAILSLVSAGMGVALVPEQVAAASFANLIFRGLDVSDAYQPRLMAVWREGDRNPLLSPALNLMARVGAEVGI